MTVPLLLLLAAVSQQAYSLPGNTISIMSYNIMDSGFADASGKYDPVGDRVPGNLTDFMASQSPFVDVLGIVETGAWRMNDTSKHPGYLSIAASWGYEHVHVRGNCAIMSHAPLEIIDEPSVGYSTIVARVLDKIFIVTSMSCMSYPTKYKAFEAMGEYVMRYKDDPLVLMGDLNSISPQDKHRYNETLICGNGTYNEAEQSGEDVVNYCLKHVSSNGAVEWKLDFKPMASLLNSSDLIDLCFVSGGFFDVDTDNLHYPVSECGLSNPTLLIHMTGRYSSKYHGSHGHDHATAKIDYILANQKMLEKNRFHHTNVIKTLQADGCSDHYPIEAVFMD